MAWKTVWCLNEKTGEEIWSHQYSAELNPNLYEGGPGATPTVHGNLVYTLSVDGRLHCLHRLTGDLLWQQNLQKDLDVDMHEWGFNGSPYILGDHLLFEAGRLAAYDRMNGKTALALRRTSGGLWFCTSLFSQRAIAAGQSG